MTPARGAQHSCIHRRISGLSGTSPACAIDWNLLRRFGNGPGIGDLAGYSRRCSPPREHKVRRSGCRSALDRSSLGEQFKFIKETPIILDHRPRTFGNPPPGGNAVQIVALHNRPSQISQGHKANIGCAPGMLRRCPTCGAPTRWDSDQVPVLSCPRIHLSKVYTIRASQRPERLLVDEGRGRLISEGER